MVLLWMGRLDGRFKSAGLGGFGGRGGNFDEESAERRRMRGVRKAEVGEVSTSWRKHIPGGFPNFNVHASDVSESQSFHLINIS